MSIDITDGYIATQRNIPFEGPTLITNTEDYITEVLEEDFEWYLATITHPFDKNKVWIKDTSPFIYFTDLPEEIGKNPCPLKEGYVWITCSTEHIY